MPKCLIELGGKTVIARDIDVLLKNNIPDIIPDIIIMTCFGEDKLSEHIGKRGRGIYKPLSEVSGILASTWLGLKETPKKYLYNYKPYLLSCLHQPSYGKKGWLKYQNL